MDAVVFASYIPASEQLFVGQELLDALQRGFSDCDVYVGINPSRALDDWVRILQASPLNITSDVVPDRLVVASDASAFQRALWLLRQSGKQYDYVWFIHTKGVVRGDNHLWQLGKRQAQITDFLGRRREVSAYLNEHSEMGSYANVLTVRDLEWDEASSYGSRLATFMDFDFPHYNAIYLFTFYVLKGFLLHRFNQHCIPAFFHKNLVLEHGCDRWFFEGDFPHIVTRQGYELGFKQRIPSPFYHHMPSDEAYQTMIRTWRARASVES